MSFDEKKRNEEISQLAMVMFEGVARTAFQKLGFNLSASGAIDADFRQLEQWIGKEWWHSDKIYVELSAHLTNEFKTALIRIGVDKSKFKK